MAQIKAPLFGESASGKVGGIQYHVWPDYTQVRMIDLWMAEMPEKVIVLRKEYSDIYNEWKLEINPTDGQSGHGTNKGWNYFYTCINHIEIFKRFPGNCPICGLVLIRMRLIKKKGESVFNFFVRYRKRFPRIYKYLPYDKEGSQ